MSSLLLGQELREAEEDLAAFRRGHEAPVLVRLLGGRDRAIDVLRRSSCGKTPSVSPSAGLVLSKVSPASASTHSPAM